MEKLHPEATEASQFLNSLHEFHRQRGTDFKFAPIVCGQELDLHTLYKSVTAVGGASKINEKPERWYEISHQIRFPDRCPNGTLVLRRMYQRYLSTYEKVTFLGEDPDMEVEDSGEVSSSALRNRNANRGGGANSSAVVVQVPMSYNRQQHDVTDGQRVNYGLSTQFAPASSPFERLCFSLQSGLPNEETFALNVCTLLANGGRHTMQLNKAPPRLIDLLIAQAGLASDDATLKDMLEESWRDCEARRMERFWQENVDPTVGKCFGLNPLPKYEKLVEQRMQDDTIELIAEGGFMASKDGLIDEDDLFNLNSEVSPRDAEAQRVLRIALILHNLSFEEANAQILAQNQGFLRMMMLSSLSRWASLRQVGLDCLSNIAPHLQLNVHDDLCCRSLLRLTVDGILKSEDRGLVTRCLDILAHLAQCENNHGTLVAELDATLFERLLELLTVHDVLLIIHSLETLFALTELGDGICERLVAIRHAIGIIVSMLSLDPISYGSSAQRGMKIVEHFDPSLPPVVNPSATHIQIQTVQAAATPVQHIVRPAQPNASIQAQVPAGSTPVGASNHGSAVVVSQEATVSETEALAIAWIRSHCELTPGASVGRQELYADYVTFCSKAGKRSVLSGQHFSTCIKNQFPQSSLKVTQVSGPNQQVGQAWQYDNLRRRATPTPVTVAPTITTSVVTQVSRNLQKQAEQATAGSTLAASTPMGTTAAATIITAPISKPKPAACENVSSKEEAHVNGIEESNDGAPEGLAARGIPPVKETGGVPAKSNGNHEVVAVSKVYKSSPLLNGLLDRGTPSVKTVNGENVDESKKVNGDGVTIIDVRKRRLTFSSDDSNSQEDHSDKKQIAGKISTKTTLHNGVSEDAFPTNNNDQSKRIKLDKSDQPCLKQANGDLSATTVDAEKAVEEPVKGNSDVLNEPVETEDKEKTSTDEVRDGAKQSSDDGKTVPEKDQEKSKEEKPEKVLRYYCEWRNCEKSFLQTRQVFLHAIHDHVGLRPSASAPPGNEEMFCEWGVTGDKKSCDNMARKRLSLCTHVQERHCSDNHLQIQAIRRQQINQFGTASLPAPQQPPPHPGYAPDAAVHAIRRHAHSFYQYKDAADEKEHPVTKSVRLTAALILRNLAKYAPECRTQLVQYEHRLAQVAMSCLESSRTIAQCLADIHGSQDSASKTLALMEQNQLFQEETRPRYTTGNDVAQSH
ncbi:AT-rich interactive domain-containing protein 2 [Galendromus occidentalis]|uniref:AT-rich interactive domain-containing protein 2 n=1 Tax=Galendromus occidentalis TaxID=34638 RepID=A0AAJ7SGK3_9ACAR|nr:AT-rich interactive domain-containing protein 2 [Galendromus occidentalis]